MLALAPRGRSCLGCSRTRLPERPPEPPSLGCHRRRIPDRDCFEAIVFRPVTGCSWDVAGRLGKGSETTRRTRFNAWVRAGVFEGLADEAIGARTRTSLRPTRARTISIGSVTTKVLLGSWLTPQPWEHLRQLLGDLRQSATPLRSEDP